MTHDEMRYLLDGEIHRMIASDTRYSLTERLLMEAGAKMVFYKILEDHDIVEKMDNENEPVKEGLDNE